MNKIGKTAAILKAVTTAVIKGTLIKISCNKTVALGTMIGW